jgi:flagellar protein FliL
MAKEKEVREAKPEIKAEAKSKSESSNKLFIIMFAGVMVIQLVIVFVVVFLFLNKGSGENPKQESKEKTENVENKGSESKPAEETKVDEGPVFSYQTKDIIVNPRGSGGKRFLMTQVGIFVSDEKFKKEIEEGREAQINGLINQFLSSKTTDELIEIERRDTLRIELKEILNKEIPGNKIKNVFFSKFVVQ